MLNQCVSAVDMHSIHLYTCADEHLLNVTAPLGAERAITMTAAMIDLARIENKVPPSKPPTRICFDEWNVWDPSGRRARQAPRRSTPSATPWRLPCG